MSDEKIVCNKENGCMSETFGRDCWVADSMLKLVEARFDPGEFPEPDATAYEKVVAYCRELRQMNKEPHFDDVIWTEERPI